MTELEQIARSMCHLSAECKTCKECNEKYHGEEGELCYFQCIAKEIITHDYRKVDHGKWEDNADGTHWCSECGHDATYTYDGIEVCGVCCPFCGADMRGETDG